MNKEKELLKQATSILKDIYNHLENLKWTNYYDKIGNFLKQVNVDENA